MSGCACPLRTRSTAVESTYVGVRFGDEPNLTLCATGGQLLAARAEVIVDVGGEARFGTVEQSPVPTPLPCQKQAVRPLLRAATAADREALARQRAQEQAARAFCQERVRALGLEMRISRVEFTLSRKRATVHFTAEKRVDFRQLVREMAQRFSARVQMSQLGARDEAKLLSGIGVCGRALCCASWLGEFKPIGIGMAKRQNLSLNPSKISGQCGRLLCCLGYEDDLYRKGGPPRPAPVLPEIP